MSEVELKEARERAGWTQSRLAARLGVTQAYLSLMESGKRRVPDRVTRALVRLFRLPAAVLPFTQSAHLVHGTTDSSVGEALSRLGYPGLAYRRTRGEVRNPAELLLKALALDELDPRLAEALPWLLLEFERLDLDWLRTQAKAMDLQNRLGFTAALARGVAERNPAYRHRLSELRRLEQVLESSRLAREDTYGRRETSEHMRAWVRKNRSDPAEHWNLLTDLKVEHLPYAG